MMRKGDGWVVILIVILALRLSGGAAGNLVLKVQHKLGGRSRSSWQMLLFKSHDSDRHRRMLLPSSSTSSIDFQLGGNGLPTDTALYYTKLSIGTPPKDYYVQVDTGSDILWVNCAGCDKCPRKSNLGIELTWYDLKTSSSGKPVTCDQEFCSSVFSSPRSDCTVGSLCEYSITYGDGSQSAGYFVQDSFQFDRISGDLQISNMNGSVVFGCSSKQSGELGSSSEAVDGIVGFGQSNSSILSQLALSGKTRKIFSHCLDSVNGGGIFAIGQVVQPKVNTTPMVPDQQHYNAILKKIEVGGAALDVFGDSFDSGSGTSAIIDSGTTLAYLPNDVYNSLMVKVMSKQPGLKTHTVEEQFKCFYYSQNVDDGFPVVTFQFEGSASLNAYPHDYLFKVGNDEWCIGWQNKAMQASDGKQLTLLGDIVLSDKLIVYDLENQTIGWTEYNCSSSIKVKDEASGNAYSVTAHDISISCSMSSGKDFIFILLMVMLWNLKA